MPRVSGYRYLFSQLVRRELRRKYKGSSLGVLWYLIAKNLGPMLTARTKQIQDSLAAGTKAKAEAEGRNPQTP